VHGELSRSDRIVAKALVRLKALDSVKALVRPASSLSAHSETAGLGADRRVWTSKRVRTRTIARVAKRKFAPARENGRQVLAGGRRFS
jgi:hypothetical protein